MVFVVWRFKLVSFRARVSSSVWSATLHSLVVSVCRSLPLLRARGKFRDCLWVRHGVYLRDFVETGHAQGLFQIFEGPFRLGVLLI